MIIVETDNAPESSVNALYGTQDDPRYIRTSSHRYGCNGHNKRKQGYYAIDGWTRNGDNKHHPNVTYIKDYMSKECRYDRKRQDPGCIGCQERDKPIYTGV